jgi:thioredoxin reductase
VVIAAGTRSKRIPGFTISDDVKKRVFYEIHPIRKTQNKKIAIIGAGDAAFDYALSLSGKNEVTILNRSGQTRCFPLLWSRCVKSKAISYLDSVSIKKIGDRNKKLQLTYTDQSGQNEKQIYADYVVIAIGRVPCLDFLGKHLKGNLINLTKTNTLYMVGDVKNKIYRQTAICVGDGIKAAMKIHRQMGKENGWR